MSKLKLISVDGSYLRSSFISKGMKWTICASESNGALMETLDTFRSNKGTYQTAPRHQIKKIYDDGHIIAVD